MKKKYNIIGDIHGRSWWKKLLIDDGINVFVGDYFSPYEEISWENQKQNFLNILDLKKENPNMYVLLIGNHDEDHWHWGEECSRHDSEHEQEIRQLFEENKEYFQMAYNIEEFGIVTHAGVSAYWYVNNLYDKNIIHAHSDLKSCVDGDLVYSKGFFYKNGDELIKLSEIKPSELSKTINDLWKQNPQIFSFFNCDVNYLDTYGDLITQSPCWIRPNSLYKSNIYRNSELFQIVGHTQFYEIVPLQKLTDSNDKLYFIDCLGFQPQSLVITTDSETYEVSTNKILIANRWKTPDGTILHSKHVHDYVSHTDKNGEHYFIDGGTDYIRRSVNNELMENMCIYSDSPFDVIRTVLYRFPANKPICELSNEHLQNIITYELDHGKDNSLYVNYIRKEIEYRAKHHIKIEDNYD